MSIGLGIVLFVIGAILAFALNIGVDWINLQLVGYILMAAGAVVVILGLVLMARRRRTISTSQTSIDPASGTQVRRDETSAPDSTAY
ncbi:DUF6458 family protein [Agromyces aureus]|uniref:DUF6458 domain-containing protein n=1 Tax=Agromyces aureus TaxID=453304 RepID=A0A191WEN0_9MICO|nr:DUF6458 family protein [Agromyces aureus]ANJ26682.1 hypothetical protein ATC03_08110 [Agromyces aureus]